MLQEISQIIRKLQSNALNEVDLRNKHVSYDDLVDLAEALKVNRSLTSIVLNRNDITAEGASALAEMLKINRSLISMNLENNQITADFARAMAEALKVNRSLTSISLYSHIYDKTYMGDEGARALADALKVNTRLISIVLSGHKIGTEGAKALAEALKINCSLTLIDLGKNNIGAEGASALAEAFTINRSLTSIDLMENGIGDIGANALAQALKANSRLTAIDLMGNRIGEMGANALAQALKVNSSLTAMSLNFNPIGDAGAKALADMLKVNSSFTAINLWETCISDAGAKAFAEAIKINTSLILLDLRGNQISYEGAKALIQALEINTSLTSIFLEFNPLISANTLLSIEILLNRNKRIAEFKRQIDYARQFEVNDEQNFDELNQQLVYLEDQLETFKGYPLIHKQLEEQFYSVYVTVYLKQMDTVSALGLFRKLSQDDEVMMHALGEQIYAMDPEVAHLLERAGLNPDDKTKAALAVLGRTFEKKETQALLKCIALDILPSSNPELGVSLLIPEDALVTQLTSLPGDALHQLESMTPQALYDYCQQEPIKQALERAFGSSSIASLESVLRHGDKFPVIVNASSYASEGKQEADDDAATAKISPPKRPIASSKLFEPSLQALLDCARRVKMREKQGYTETMTPDQFESGAAITADGIMENTALNQEASLLSENLSGASSSAGTEAQEQKLLDDYRNKIIQQIDKYKRFKDSLRHWQISDSRQKPGFFSRVRHYGAEGYTRAEVLMRDLKTTESIDDIKTVMAKFLNDKNTPYHQNSLSSFVLDALVELDSPWQGLATAHHYSRQEIMDRGEIWLEAHSVDDAAIYSLKASRFGCFSR